MKKSAAWDRVHLIRAAEKPPKVLIVDIRGILVRKKGDHVLQPGDVIYVPRAGEVVDKERIAQILKQARPDTLK